MFGIFCPNNQNCQFKLKFGTYNNSYMQNSMVLFTFCVVDQKYLFSGKFGPKIQNGLQWNLVPTISDKICETRNPCSLVHCWLQILPDHSWSALLDIAFLGLIQHWTWGKGEFLGNLEQVKCCFRTFLKNIASLNNFCH